MVEIVVDAWNVNVWSLVVQEAGHRWERRKARVFWRRTTYEFQRKVRELELSLAKYPP